MEKAIELVINPSELGAGTRGSALGPYAVLYAGRKRNSSLFYKLSSVVIPNNNELLDQPINYLSAKRINGVCEVYDKVMGQMKQSLSTSSTVLVLSGDHSSATATIAGIRNKYPEKKLGVVWVDAHADIHSPYTTPSGNIHGMSLGAALGIDNKNNQINNPKENVIKKWNWMKKLGPKSTHLIKPEDIIYIGLRDIEKQEETLISSLNIKTIETSEFQKSGALKIAEEVEHYFKDYDLLYISFDVDSMDPMDSSFGTGTPFKNGILVKDAKILLGEFAKSEKLKCLEIVEINPLLDTKNKMGEIGFSLLENCIKNILEKQKVPLN
ncbi:MAG: arginase [Crocinitomicaceae bacterium]|nr:arginase [Crocinitomicaceae bacterium]